MIEVKFTSQARRGLIILRGFDDGRILDVIGNNGAGKSSAAKVLMIITGDFRFNDRLIYQRFKDQVGNTSVELKCGKDLYKAGLTPEKWIFDEKTQRILKNTIGNYWKNNSPISIEEFQELFEVRIIRGNETLATQIEFFVELVTKKLVEYKEIVEKEYEKHYESSRQLKKRVIDKIDQLSDLVKLDKESTEEEEIYKEERNKIWERKEHLIELQNQLDEIADWGSDNIPELEKRLSKLSEEKRILAEDLETIQKESQDLEKKIGKNEEKETRELEKAQSVRDQAAIDNQDIIRRIADFKKGNEILNSITKEGIDKVIDKQKEIVLVIQKQYEELTRLSKTQNSVMEALKRIHEIVREIIVDGYPDEISLFLSIESSPRPIEKPITFSALEEVLKYTMNRISNNIIEDATSDLEELVSQQKNETEVLELLKELQKTMKVLKKAKKNVEKITSALGDSAQELKTLLFTLSKLKEDEENFSESYIGIEAEHSKISSRLDVLRSYPSKKMLVEKAKEILDESFQSEFKVNLSDYEDTKKFISYLKGLIEESVRQIGVYDGLTRQIQDSMKKRAKDIGKLRKQLITMAKDEGVEREEFVRKSKSEMEHLEKLTENLKAISNTIEDLIYSLSIAEKGEKEDSTSNQNILDVQELFNNFFVEIYSADAFMKNVFHQYDRIVGFDILEKEIILESNGAQFIRKLTEFSSGEKSYAFARAMMSLPMNRGKYRILILDEFEALLDYEHSEDLRKFEKDIIDTNLSSKIINIHPDKSPLKEKESEYKKIIKSAEKSKDEKLLDYYKQQLEEIQNHMEEIRKWRHYQIARY